MWLDAFMGSLHQLMLVKKGKVTDKNWNKNCIHDTLSITTQNIYFNSLAFCI